MRALTRFFSTTSTTTARAVAYARADGVADTFILFDGGCPVCAFEAHHLRRWASRRHAKIAFVNVFEPPAELPQPVTALLDMNSKLTRQRLMFRMHAVVPAGEGGAGVSFRLVRGPDAFRAMYRAAGLGFLADISAWSCVAPWVNRAYEFFARNRHQFIPRVNGAPKCDLCVSTDPDAPPSTSTSSAPDK
jgi:predicted DCC family thiol-disulfide oxidoreductase YuxK